MGFLALVHSQGSPEGSQILPSWVSAAESPRSSCDLCAGAELWAGGAGRGQGGHRAQSWRGSGVSRGNAGAAGAMERSDSEGDSTDKECSFSGSSSEEEGDEGQGVSESVLSSPPQGHGGWWALLGFNELTN